VYVIDDGSLKYPFGFNTSDPVQSPIRICDDKGFEILFADCKTSSLEPKQQINPVVAVIDVLPAVPSTVDLSIHTIFSGSDHPNLTHILHPCVMDPQLQRFSLTLNQCHLPILHERGRGVILFCLWTAVSLSRCLWVPRGSEQGNEAKNYR
jgi:hypothetical protein